MEVKQPQGHPNGDYILEMIEHSMFRNTPPAPSKHRSSRLRKKLYIGEFQELGFALTIDFRAGLTDDARNAFWDAFLSEAVEPHGLAYGGGTEGFVSLFKRGTMTKEQRESVRRWLAGRNELSSFQAGDLVDAYYG